MSQIQIRVPDDLLAILDERRKKRFQTRTAYIISAIADKIVNDGELELIAKSLKEDETNNE